MKKGTNFGGILSDADLNLIQQKVDVQPAEPKLNLVNVPGADGARDFTEQPAGRVTYKTRKITWTFALYPGDKWHDKHRQVNNALNGLKCQITLHDDPDYYYEGRLAVSSHNVDKTLRQIVVEAVCQPYKLRHQVTVKTAALPSTHAFVSIPLSNERKLVVPEITVTTATVLRYGGAQISVNAGTHTLLDIALQPGVNTLEARTADNVSTAGSIRIQYREGAL